MTVETQIQLDLLRRVGGVVAAVCRLMGSRLEPGMTTREIDAMGGAIAVHLLEDEAFDGRVTIIERDPTFKRASSALSAAGTRRQFSTPENIRMSAYSFAWMRERLDVGIHEGGYLYLGSSAMVANLASVQGRLGRRVIRGRASPSPPTGEPRWSSHS